MVRLLSALGGHVQTLFSFVGFRFFRNLYFHSAILIVYFQSLGFSLTQALFLESVFAISKFCFDIPTGIFADRYGRRLSLGLSGCIAGAAYLGMAFASNYHILMTIEVALGLAMSLANGADSALVYEYLKQSERTELYRRFDGAGWGANRLASMFAALASPIVISLFSLSATFLATALGVFTSAAWVFGLPKGVRPQRKVERSGNFLEALKGTPKRLLAVILLFGILGATVRVGTYVFQPVLTDLGVSPTSLGPILALTMLFSALAAFSNHRIRIGAHYHIGMVILTPLSVFFFLCAGSLYAEGRLGIILAMMAFVLHGAIRGIYDPIINEYVNSLVQSDKRAMTLSFLTSSVNILFSCLAPLFGYCYEELGGFPTLMFAAFLVIVPLYFVVAIGRRSVSAG